MCWFDAIEEDVVPGNVARLYARMARDLRDGTRTAPSFEDAVALHRVIAAIEKAAASGSRTANLIALGLSRS
jgi:predicted dehydrogenase